MAFVPLQVRFFLRAPVLLGYAWVHGDGLLEHMAARAHDADYFNLPSKYVVSLDGKASAGIAAIRHDQSWFYVASVWRPRHQATTTIYKRFDTEHLGLLRTRKKSIDLSSGPTRNWVLPFVIALDPVAEFRFLADPDRLADLLPHITHIGKKHGIGYGEVRGYEVEELHDPERVLVDAGRATRPLPTWACEGWKREQLMVSALRPPYWDKSSLAACVAPGEPVLLQRWVVEELWRWTRRT